jgi:stearoyl-CoA desaturase (delta-9 desaturase)
LLSCSRRLFVHQAYEATLPLQLFYAVFIFASLTGSPIAWIKTHRTHHEHSDTALDPHNSHKGFWHSHFGWTLWEPSTAIKRERLFQKTNFLEYEWAHMLMEKIYEPLGAFITLLLPVLGLRAMGIAFADINYLAVFLTTWIRLCVGLNMAASVNSLAHTFGERHHNPNIEARNNFFVSLFTWGEGWHNYHHAFPKDFRASSKDNFVLYWCFISPLILS